MGQRFRQFTAEEQAAAVARGQVAVWRSVVARFEQLRAAEGLRQADLASALGVSRPQISEWLSEPRNMTLKAAGRLLLAMNAEMLIEVEARESATGEANAGGATSKDQGAATSAPWRLGASVLLLTLMAGFGPPSRASAWAGAPPPRLASLGDAAIMPTILGQPTILVFWRADCGPCLVELGHLRELEAASGSARLALVSLDGAQTARDKLKAMRLAPRHAWRLRDDPAQTLSTLGGGAPRLPLSVAYDAAGRPCGLRVGLLGVDQVRRWARSCS